MKSSRSRSQFNKPVLINVTNGSVNIGSGVKKKRDKRKISAFQSWILLLDLHCQQSESEAHRESLSKDSVKFLNL